MASASFQPKWDWPSEASENSGHDPAPHVADEQPPDAPATAPSGTTTTDAPPPGPAPPHSQRHYKPRTCRICLDTVQPTTDIDDSLAGRVFASRARVRYVSDDPELGRLISPCKCKGSQKYVHEGCLQAWRKTSPLSERNYWRCPTCQFEYRLQRLRWGRWLSSKFLRAALTMVIMTVTIFLLGFIADPIIGLWVDPFGSITSGLTGFEFDEPVVGDDGPDGWATHFVKGFLSLGLLGFLKTMFVMSPWNWFNIRVGGGRRRRGTGRDRMEQINWALVVIGVLTFLGATWKFVNHLMAKALEQASNHVVDVQEDTPDDDDEADGPAPEAADGESRKDR